MRFRQFSDYEALSTEAARLFQEAVSGRHAPTACLATGHSPLGLYRRLAKSAADLGNLNIVKLDEWLGLPKDHPATCEKYLREEVLGPLGLPETQFVGFRPDPTDPGTECLRMQDELLRLGKIDICVLGLGKNGHLGMNEPAISLKPHCHRAQLAVETRQHAMLTDNGAAVTEGLTLGMADILMARRILLLVSGPGKRAAFESLRHPGITTRLPASFLWLHPGVEVLVDGTI